uniref:GRAM domain-containing protein n=1 Tax=Leersia perrieri TaxID=77586 RepID=A0A0D9VYQ3_9ORYZ
MATPWSSAPAAPPPGYPQVVGQPAYPPQSTAVAVTPASNGVGNPYVIVTPASATPSTCNFRTAPNMADAAVARLAQGTKVYAEGGHDRVFNQAFGIVPGEQLRKAYACYLSTSTGPIIGTLYVSTARLAFCSDSPISYQPSPAAGGGAAAAAGGHPPEGIYYKAITLHSCIFSFSLVVLPLNQVKSVNPSASMANRGEKYIQIMTTDNHEFWFMGFVSYDKALKNLYEALQRRA